MKLVVDANILFSALIKDSVARRLFFEWELELYAPEYLFEEFAAHREEILRKSKRTEEEFGEVMAILESRMRPVPLSAFAKFMKKARRVSPDKGDDVYFAVAFAVGAAIWSNDKKLKSQKTVRVLDTEEIVLKGY